MESAKQQMTEVLQNQTTRLAAVVGAVTLAGILTGYAIQESSHDAAHVSTAVVDVADRPDISAEDEKTVSRIDILSCYPDELRRVFGVEKETLKIGMTYMYGNRPGERDLSRDTEYWNEMREEVDELLRKAAFPTEFSVSTVLHYVGSHTSLAQARVHDIQEQATAVLGLGGGSPVPPYATTMITPSSGIYESFDISITRRPICPA